LSAGDDRVAIRAAMAEPASIGETQAQITKLKRPYD